MAANSGPGRIIADRLTAAQNDQEVGVAFRTHYLAHWIAAANTLLQRGIKEGEFRADLNTEVALDAIYGPLYFACW